MSQADEESAKSKINNHHQHQHHYSHYGQMRKTTTNQQVMPLYENCILKNDNTNNTYKPDQTLLERPPVKSETVNNDYRFVSNTTNDADISEQQARDFNSIASDYEYENINIGGKETLDKRILLQKYFRSALVGPRTSIYENLCRGCNYGVFNARGPLCSFCECIVNGVSALRSDTPETSLATSNNIYENICEHCGVIYSGPNCLECRCPQADQEQLDIVKSEEFENLKNLSSEDLLIEKSVKPKKNNKVKKSKSFSKTNKPKILTNLWDTIRKPKTNTQTLVSKRPLEIIHHVEGFEQVFHTKDTFDLKKICELKRSATSCSDQHIYGRLKLNEDLIAPQDEFNSTQSLTQTITTGKRPRISKAKFLRTGCAKKSLSSELKTDLASCTIYLNNSVCQWMTSLRREIHAYNTSDEHDQETLCYPKSIPSKNVLSSCKAPIAVTHHMKNLQNLTQKPNNEICGDLAEILQGFSDHFSVTSTDSGEIQEVEKTPDNQQPDCYQLMVEAFMANILNRQMLKAKSNNQQIENVKATMAGVNNSDSYTNNCNNNNNSSNYNYDSIADAIDIPLRQATLTATSTAPTTTATNSQNTHINNKHKRQGMYLRLEDPQQQLVLPSGEEQLNLLNKTNEISNKSTDYTNQNESESVEMQRAQLPNLESRTECDYLKFVQNANTVTTPATLMTSVDKAIEIISRGSNSSGSRWGTLKSDKRQGIHERNVLEAFQALLDQKKSNLLVLNNNEQQLEESQIACEQVAQAASGELQPLAVDVSIIRHINPQIPDLIELTNQQHLSAALNTLIICYDKYLKVFLQHISQTNTNTSTITSSRAIVFQIPSKRLVRKFKRFYNYCEKNNAQTTRSKALVRDSTCVSSKLKLDLDITNGFQCAQKRAKNICDSLDTLNDLTADNSCASVIITPRNQKTKTPPQVPRRDPKTKLSPTSEIKRFLNDPSTMTKPGMNLKTETKSEQHKEEESIYQPIWKFETKGQVPERYRTDDDYYDFKALRQKFQQDSPDSEIPKICVSSDLMAEEEEDHYNWETDEEFVFTKQQKKQRSSSLSSDRLSTMRSITSSNSSIGTAPSLSGSTITEFASSTATLASTLSCSLRHYLFRNIGIFYSLTEPKLRAIIYDYDRIHSTKYFAKSPAPVAISISDSGLGKSLSPHLYNRLKHSMQTSYSSSSSPSSSAKTSPVTITKRVKNSNSASDKCSTGAKAKVAADNSSLPAPLTIPNSVQAWKLQLMDFNYMEDEEDLIVSECEILRAQQIKEDIDQAPAIPPQKFVQHFKSRSTENFLDLPIEDDKKTIAERLANMYTRFSPIQRGILNINGRNSPKSEKKAYKLNRASQSTSLYLEDGLKPKYPIFGAPLDQLELQQNVPRFVVDAVDYIERKDRIIQDGIYRACGNKFSIDELKQKLTKHYIYDSKLIVADDIHTVTSLLKQFFRDLPEPVIPQEIYNSITTNLTDKEGIEAIQIALEKMKEPNKSTLRFLIKHLTNVAACSSSNRMNASNMAIVWGPSLFAQNDTYDMIGRMNTLTKVLIENYDRIFATNERLL